MYTKIRTVAGCLMLLQFCAFSLSIVSAQAQVKFPNSIVNLSDLQPSLSPSAVTPADPEIQKETLKLSFTLKTANDQELKDRASKGELISPGEMAAKYSGSKASANSLI